MTGFPAFSPHIFTYDRQRHDFRRLLCGIFNVSDLETLAADVGVLERGTDQSTQFHKQFYDSFAGMIRQAYLLFIDEVIAPRFTEPFCFQAVPTFRVHLPGNVAVGEFHTDGDYNHSDGEINYWVPFTRAYGTNSVFIESPPGSGGFQAAEAGFGDVLTFDAVRSVHGNRINVTGRTRVSFDFRCIAMSAYRPRGLKTVNAGKALEIGDYFERSSCFGPRTAAP